MAYAEPNSIAFLFTDAGAKDYHLYSTVLAIIQKKQVKVNFMITDLKIGRNSYDNTLPTVEVYDEIAKASEGQVFKMARGIVKQVLLSIKQSLEPKYETLLSVNSDKAGTTRSTVKVDASFSQVSVTYTGTQAQLLVTNSKNEKVQSVSSFSSDNIQFITFDVSGSDYTIHATASSASTLRVGGISELKMLFGFSTNIPKELAETSFRPLKESQNILSVFVSDVTLVKCLTRAVLIPANKLDGFPEVEVPFESIHGSMYSTALIDIPKKMFKIKVVGYDKNGNLIDREISIGLESVAGGTHVHCFQLLICFSDFSIVSDPPEVTVKASNLIVNQFDELSLECKVISLVPLTTTWMFESKNLLERTSK